MNKPLVSICIPAYNSAKYLRQCLDSIAAQTYGNIEVIIGDDRSRDETVAIAREYVDRCGFRLHLNETNKGAGETSSILVGLARGEFIAVYHSDDVYDPAIVAESVALLQGDQNIGMAGTMANIIDESGNRTGAFRLHEALRSRGPSVLSFDKFMLGVLLNKGSDIVLVTPSVMVRKSVYDQLGKFNAASYGVAYDYEMWFRIATRHGISVIDAPLMSYRIHGNQISEVQIRQNTDVQKIVLVLRDYRRYISDRVIRRLCDRMLNKWTFRTARRQNYRRQFDKSDETLKLIDSSLYALPRILLQLCNRLKFSLKPGRN